MKMIFKKFLQNTELLSFYFDMRDLAFFSFQTDFIFVSHPKAGRTWIRMMLAQFFHKKYNLPISLDIFGYARENKKIPRIFFTHSTSAFHKYAQYNQPKFFKYSLRPIIFLARDPRDMTVSYYHEIHDRNSGNFRGSLSEFIRSKKYGIHNTVRFLNDWHEYLSNRNKTLLTTYEDFQINATAEFSKLLQFLNINAKDKNIESAVEASRFEKMKKMERKDKLSDERLRAVDKKDKDTFKVRRGQPGAYEKELSENDKKYVDTVIEKLHPAFDYNKV